MSPIGSAGLLLLLGLGAVITVATTDDKIYVHVVPHTHDDVGWLKTVDEYFYGANNTIQHASVQFILDTVIDELQKNPNRTFIYVEMAFFVRWWNEQSDDMKDIVRKLVTETHQLEFINAGWCMNDEAATDYNAIIDQMSIGLRFVEENFGPTARPRVGWHIDPFGHSAQMATIHSLLGMDGFFFARIDYDDRNTRLNDKTMEMVWQSSQSLGAAGDIFTGVLYYFYGPPPGFCFDVKCDNAVPVQDDPRLFGYNVDERVKSFVKVAQQQADFYTTNHIMFTMGSDFNYEDAAEWFKNLDKLMYYVNKMSDDVEVFYSTPSRYLDALNKADKTWTTKSDDFFPYADNPYSYWTGYFTSRPALKGYTRVMNSLLQSCKQIEVLGEQNGIRRHTNASSVTLQQAMGVDQHHDAVSGTEKQHVADDYAKRLHIGQVECQELINDVLMGFLSSVYNVPSPSFEFCEYLNISVCPVTETNSFNAVAYFPVGRMTPGLFEFPVTADSFEVLDDQGNAVEAQVIPLSEATKNIRGYRGKAENYITWIGIIGPMSTQLYFVRPTKKGRGTSVFTREYVPKPGADFSIDNGALNLTFDGKTGRLKTMDNTLSKVSAKVDQNFLWWNSSAGNNVNSSQASGAYIFRPNGTSPFEINGSIVKTKVLKGPLVSVVTQEWAPWLYQSISLYKDTPLAIFEFTVGPIPFQDGLGKEIVSRFTTDFKTNSKFYTDANGRQMLERIRNFRPTWKYNNTEPVAGNYYPVDSRIFIKDEDRGIQFTVMTDRAQGGASLNDGQLELMVHRRMLYSDSRGVGEALNETGQNGDGLIIRGRHYVILDHYLNSTIDHRLLGEYLMTGPQFAFTPSNMSYDEWTAKYPTQYYGITNQLQPNVHLLTLERLDHTHHLLRLEHQFPIDEGPFNNTVNVTLGTLFTSMKVVDAVELSLGANALLSDIHRLHWKTKTAGDRNRPKEQVADKLKPPFVIELKPMEIRTFNITVEYM